MTRRSLRSIGSHAHAATSPPLLIRLCFILGNLSAANAQSGRQVAQLQNMDQTGDQVKIDLALQGQRQALEKLVVHHNKDLRDIKIMMDHWGM